MRTVLVLAASAIAVALLTRAAPVRALAGLNPGFRKS